MPRQYESLQLSARVDHNYPLHGRYEYVLFDGEEVVCRFSGFKSKAAAVRAGKAAAEKLLAAALPPEEPMAEMSDEELLAELRGDAS